jgi:hypothetical protein
MPAPRLRWWREVLYCLGIYLIYSRVRNEFGSNGNGEPNRIAYEHALDIVRLEDAVGLFVERSIQRWYLDLPGDGFIAFWNVFYGTAHFVVTAFALIWCYHKGRERYAVWRNTLAFTTVFALVGFATFSLMPPRLMDSTSEYGPPADLNAERDFHFVDTLATYETFWSFDSEELKDVSNQYAAMPSLHTGWSMWAALVLIPMVRRRWLKGLIALHPVATVFCIVVTGNHFWLDAVGGAAILGAGFLAGRALAGWWDRRAELRRPDGVAVVAAEGDQLLLGSGPDPQP